ncbi:MAG: hypothetical protein IPL12_06115 [Bacteroidetes bacterium]|nr:hypothetical protein [Bacteroidota bacterium]
MIDEFHRFSKDIDIILETKPENLHQIFDAIVANTPFIKWEQSERKNDEFHVPKEHYKILYKESKPSKFPEKNLYYSILYLLRAHTPKLRLSILNMLCFQPKNLTQK